MYECGMCMCVLLIIVAEVASATQCRGACFSSAFVSSATSRSCSKNLTIFNSFVVVVVVVDVDRLRFLQFLG